jgi:hypothetical protein
MSKFVEFENRAPWSPGAISTLSLWGPYTAVMMDCFQISQIIGSISFHFCPREANKVAHNLARLSFDSDTIYWDGDLLSSVMQDVLKDISLFEI